MRIARALTIAPFVALLIFGASSLGCGGHPFVAATPPGFVDFGDGLYAVPLRSLWEGP